MMRLSRLAVAAAAFAICGAAHATEFVQNGDFTQTPGGLGQLGYNGISATDWSVLAPPNSYTFVFNQGATPVNGQYGGVSLWTQANGGNVPSGNNTWDGYSSIGSAHNFVGMDSDFQTSALTQTINGLVVGQQYTLTFDYAFGQQAGFTGATTGQWTFSLGGATSQTSVYSVPSAGFTGWQSESATFTATSASEVLSFLASGNPQVPPFALLSNVELNGPSAAPGPGPATGPLAVLGLLALGYARLRARGQA